jgi:hypothetical protein
MQAIPFLVNQQVRDLAWACFGHNLIDDFSSANNETSVSSCQIPLTEQRRHWLQTLDQAPASLLDALRRARSPRLGIYYEALWQYFIAQDEQLSLIANNLQVEKNKQTLGEFDLIYQDLPSGDYVHLELAIKFYLNCSSRQQDENPVLDTGLEYWLGPNQIDRLDKKLARMLEHQIMLSENSEAKLALEELGVHRLRKSIALKGMLFYPNALSAAPINNATMASNESILAADHPQGSWLNFQHFPAICNRATHWKKLARVNWISPAYHPPTGDSTSLLKPQQMMDWLNGYFSRFWQPVMISAMTQHGAGYGEQQRYFITADNWPTEKPTNKTYAPETTA